MARNTPTKPREPRPGPSDPKPRAPSPRPRLPRPDPPKREPRPDPKGPSPRPRKPRDDGDGGKKAALAHIRSNQAKKGNENLSRKELQRLYRRNVRADKHGAAYGYDFAGDGGGDKDEDYGSEANNRRRKKSGYKPNKKKDS